LLLPAPLSGKAGTILEKPYYEAIFIASLGNNKIRLKFATY